MSLDARPSDRDNLGRLPPPGWQVGCRPEDRAWIEDQITAEHPQPIDLLTGYVPGGFESAAAVFFPLYGGSSQDRRQWFAPDDPNPWTTVDSLATHGVDDDRYLADQVFSTEVGRALVDLLVITGDDLYTCGFFLGNRAWTATGSALAAELTYDLEGQATVWDVPDLFFPHDRSWYALAPYDFGWLYLVGTRHIVEQIQARADLTTLPCRLPPHVMREAPPSRGAGTAGCR